MWLKTLSATTLRAHLQRQSSLQKCEFGKGGSFWIDIEFFFFWFYPQCAGPLRPSWRNRKPRRSRLKFPDPNRRHCCKSLTRCRLVLRANSYFGSDQRDELCKSLDFPIFQSVQQINCTFITLVSWCWPHQNTLIAQRYQFDSIDLNCSQWFILNCPHRKQRVWLCTSSTSEALIFFLFFAAHHQSPTPSPNIILRIFYALIKMV